MQTGVVSADFFDVLGVPPLLGRTFRAADDSKNAPAVLVLSYAYWQNALGGDPAIVGRTFELNDRVHTVVGVLRAATRDRAITVDVDLSSFPFLDPDNAGRRSRRMTGWV